MPNHFSVLTAVRVMSIHRLKNNTRSNAMEEPSLLIDKMFVVDKMKKTAEQKQINPDNENSPFESSTVVLKRGPLHTL